MLTAAFSTLTMMIVTVTQASISVMAVLEVESAEEMAIAAVMEAVVAEFVMTTTKSFRSTLAHAFGRGLGGYRRWR